MSLKSLIRTAKQRRDQPATPTLTPAPPPAPAPVSLSADIPFAPPPSLSEDDWHQHRIGDIPTCFYYGDWLTDTDEQRLLDQLPVSDDRWWIGVKGRRLRSFGAMPGADHSAMPLFLESLIDRLTHSELVWPASLPRPNHALVNCYRAGEGIHAHKDGPAYEPRVMIVSLGSTCVMRFDARPPHVDSTDPPAFALLLEPRSLLVFTDELYTKYFHSIEPLHSDEISDDTMGNLSLTSASSRGVLPRSDRVSLTIRHAH